MTRLAITIILLLILGATGCSTSTVLTGDTWILRYSECNEKGECGQDAADKTPYYIYYENLRSASYALLFKENGQLVIVMYEPEYTRDGRNYRPDHTQIPEFTVSYRIENGIIIISDPGTGKATGSWKIISLLRSAEGEDVLIVSEKGVVKKYTR